MSHSEILTQLYTDLRDSDLNGSHLNGSDHSYQLVKLEVDSEKITGQSAMIAKISELNIEQGWITFPEKGVLVDNRMELEVLQAPLEAELVVINEQAIKSTVKIRYLGGDVWLVSYYRLVECQAGSEDITHLANPYREKMVKGQSGFLEYQRLWCYSPEKGMHIEYAVLQGLSGAQQ